MQMDIKLLSAKRQWKFSYAPRQGASTVLSWWFISSQLRKFSGVETTILIQWSDWKIILNFTG